MSLRRPTRRNALLGVAGLATCAVIPAVPMVAGLAHAGTAPHVVGVRRDRFGSLEILSISDGHFDLPVEAFPGITDKQSLGLGHLVRVGATAWAIRSKTRTVLIDTGSGAALRESAPATGWMEMRLRAARIEPEDVTDIVLTHLHLDHIGGLTIWDAPLYPNAVIHVADAEWRYWTDPATEGSLPAYLRPLAAGIAARAAKLPYEVARFSGELDLGQGIRVEPLPGHTPGHVCVHISEGDREILIVGDALVAEDIQFAHPNVRYRLDADPALAAESRRRLFDRLATDQTPFTATHLTLLAPCRLMRSGAGYQRATC